MLERLLTAAGARLVADVAPGAGPPTVAALATAVESSEGRLKIDWTRLRGFADWADQHLELLAAALVDAPARTGTPLDAILAAFAEQLADDHHIPRPRWTRAIGPLGEEWSPPLTPRMRSAAVAATPEPFRRRKIILARSALFRQAA